MSDINLSGRIIVSDATIGSSIPVIGRVKTGIKVSKTRTDGREIEYPQSLDHFIATGDYADLFTTALGEKPTSITIVFPSDDLRQVCYERYECRDQAGRRVGVSDGQTTYLYNEVTRQLEHCQDRDQFAKAGKWRHVLTLRFLIPEIGGVFGLWEYSTYGEKSTIPMIRETFDYVQAFAGTVRGIPFDLTVTKVKSQQPGDAMTFPVVKIVPNLSVKNLDKVRAFVASGVPLPVLLDDDSIAQLSAGEDSTPLALPPSTEGS